RANHPIPPQCKLFYFEVDIIDEGKNKKIGIGFCEKEFNLNSMPGRDYGSWGYHNDRKYGYFWYSGSGNSYGPSFSTGDTIGCCLNFKNNTVFYTKNGINLGSIAFRDLKGTLYPCVGLRSQGGSIEVNFGSRKFKFAGNAE
ncbi:concanavalin A-like lectin/glucanase domain-containing protein, partial [Gigaspora rosea]